MSRPASPPATLIGCTFLGAWLVFSVQPMLGRFVLPWFGGAPAVWTTTLLFFQLGLLLGYLAAHVVRVRGLWRGWRWAVVVSVVLLPVAPESAGSVDHPYASVLWVLLASVGLPYVLVAATAPLIQARADQEGVSNPYHLYAWSNAGSLLALVGYPILMEPLLGARAQTWLWSGLYVAWAALTFFILRGGGAAEPVERSAGGLRWAALAACGSALLLSVSESITQDLSVTPVLWVLPLSLYLLTFILAFGAERWRRERLGKACMVLGALALVVAVGGGWRTGWATQLALYGAGLFGVCLALHGALARIRPEGAKLTTFYLWVAAGGALGGLFVTTAPLWLPEPLELQISLIGAYIAHSLVAQRRDPFAPPRRGLQGLAYLLLIAALVWQTLDRRVPAERSRGFFGPLAVRTLERKDPSESLRYLLVGRIAHGFQYLSPARAHEPTTYFVPSSGVGQVLGRGPREVGILGLGIGTLAAYAGPGDDYRFYELDPEVTRVARSHFSFLGRHPVIEGDARQSLERERRNDYEVLVVDAFSGDAIPTHLLTREAIALYLRHLRPAGILAINVSNNHADLTRVVRAHARHFGLAHSYVRASAPSPLGRWRSEWMLLARESDRLPPSTEGASSAPELVWTDDHAPVLPLLR